MNNTSISLIQLLKKYSSHFLNDSRVSAFMVTGSVGKGYADDNSDIDCSVFINEPVSNEEFESIKRKAIETGGGFYHGTPKEGFAVYEFNEGVKMDFGIMEQTKFEQMLDEHFANPDLTNNDMNIICEGFLACIPLKGEQWINKTKEFIRGQMTDELAKKMIEKSMRFHTRFETEKMAAERGEILYLYENFMNIQKNILGILYGLNRMYNPGKIKGCKYYVDKMKIKPGNIYERFASVYCKKPEEAIKDTYDIIYETYDLIDKYMPSIDTKKKRESLEMKLRK